MTRILGIDCAVDDGKIGLAKGRFESGKLIVEEACQGQPQKVIQQLLKWLETPEGATLLAIDAPLGWPARFATTLLSHEAGQVLSEESSDRLFRRYTDCRISAIKRPLDVGADRIARTAHRALKILEELEAGLAGQRISLAWSPDRLTNVSAIEVYPAATLAAWTICEGCDLNLKKYKDSQQGADVRGPIVDFLQKHLDLADDRAALCRANHDVLDAVVCLLAGADFLAGRSLEPPEEREHLGKLVRKEGWIWCRTCSKLETEKAAKTREDCDALYGASPATPAPEVRQQLSHGES